MHELTATPKAKVCDNESPNIIPTEVDTEPRHAINPSLATSLSASVGDDEYTNKAVARTALIMQIRPTRVNGLRGRVSFSVPRSRWGFPAPGSAGADIVIVLKIVDC